MSTTSLSAYPNPATGDRLHRILLVEDDPDVAASLVDDLEADRFAVTVAVSGEDALLAAARSPHDLALIDVGLPGMSGLDVVAALREGRPDGAWDCGMAIVMVTGRCDPQSVVRGIERGADDYIAKPFHYPELLARVGAQLRRAQGITRAGAIHVGPLEIDRRALAAFVHGHPMRLPTKEFELLSARARDPSRVVAKQELMRTVWGYPHQTRSRTVDTHASRLRRRLADAGLHGWVRNLWGFGYRLLPEEH